MADYTETIILKDYKLGDRWIGIVGDGGASGIIPTVNTATPTNDLTRVVMTFKLGQTTYTLDSDDDEITIDDANTWACSVAARDTFLPRSGLWSWTMEFFQVGQDAPLTLYAGPLRAHPDV